MLSKKRLLVGPSLQKVLIAIILSSFSSAIEASENSVVSVVVSLQHGGRVQGSTLTNEQGLDFFAFRGIPYAEPPVGDLRFKPPLPKALWTDVIVDATEDGPVCTQLHFTTNQLVGEEDCLRINVYTRELPGLEKKGKSKPAVMVFFHGGAFMVGEGSSAFYSPTRLMDTDIVLVTVNYRLNAFGFLSTGDKASPGNYGLLDQTLALKWIQENIEVFGGDPDRVTIFGESAGGGSVSHHVLSPLSKGLFHGVIAMSGTSTCSWAINEDESYWAKRLAKDLNCPVGDSQELVDCLRKIPSEDIVKKAFTYMKASFLPIPFAPVVDGYFLPDHPLTLLESIDNLNRVPFISGITEEEGAFFMTHIYAQSQGKSLLSPGYLVSLVDILFSNPEPIKEVTKLIEEAYFDSIDNKNGTQMEAALIDAMSEGFFDTCHFETLSLMSKAGLQTYAYSYEYESTFSFQELIGKHNRKWGVAHLDDLVMLFNFPGSTSNDRDKDMSNIMIKVWTNFAKHGVPIPEDDDNLPDWPLVKDGTFPIYRLNDHITVDTYDLDADPSYHFWTKDIRKARAKHTAHTYKEEL